MKLKYLLLISFLMISYLGTSQITITGLVSDTRGTPLTGTNIIEKGTINGVLTDIDGKFSLELKKSGNAILEVSYIGFITQEISVGEKTDIKIVLQEDSTNLEEVVLIAYGTQKKTSLTASVSSVKGEDIARKPVSNISSSLSGRVPGLIVRQNSGEPGLDGTTLTIRGAGTTGNTAPLVIVDGIPRSLNQIDPQSVESISFLKDAAAVAPYGVAGANGVILVNTKQGKLGKMQLTYSGFYGIQNPTILPEMVTAVEYAKMRNVAAANSGQSPVYTDEQIQKYTDGSDPDVYHNHDVLGEVITKNSPMTSHNLSISGGTKDIKFFGALGFLNQQGMWGPTNFKRYNLTTNVTGKVTNTTKFNIGINSRIEERNYPNISSFNIFTQLLRTPPTAPLTFSNGLWGGYIGRSAYGNIFKSGNSNEVRPILLSQISLEQELPIKGLSIKGVFSYDYNDADGGTRKIWSTPIPYYRVDTSTTPYTYPKQGSDGPALPTFTIWSINRQAFTYQGFLNYSNSFGNSDVGATFVLESRDTNLSFLSASRINYIVNIPELNNGGSSSEYKDNSGSSGEAKQRAIVFRANYAFQGKYFLEVSGRYDGHYVFAPGKRWHLFPAFSVGWRISEESFMENYSWIDNLKIRGSYGESGALPYINNQIAPFQYLNSFNLRGNSAVLNNSITQGIIESPEANPNITWETANKTNIGFELSVLKGLFYIEFDYFFENRDNMLASPQVLLPSEYGVGIAQVNAGKMENSGFDFIISSNYTLKNDIRLGLDMNFTYANNKLIEVFENDATKNNPDRTRTGRSLGTQFGYEALGLFQQGDDTNGDGTISKDEYPIVQFGTLHPGDIKYKDQNGDNKIDGNDEVVIGNPITPKIIYSFTPSIKWKGFDANFLFQGAALQSFRLSGQAAFPFENSGSAIKKTLDYWTPENPNAKYPRVLATPSTNTSQVSSWWIRDGSYLRLKSAEIGYTLPSSILKYLKIQSIRLSISGQNVFTWSGEWTDFDPEINANNGSHYPQQQVFTFGINVTF